MRGLTPKVVKGALVERFGKDFDLDAISDRQLVEAVQDYKVAHNETFFSSSRNIWPGLLRRAHAERADLSQLASHEETVQRFNRGQSATPIDDVERVAVGMNRLMPRNRDDGESATRLQALEGSVQRLVYALDESMGRQPDEASRRMVLSLTKLALENGFDHVNHVVLSEATSELAAGANVFIVLGEVDSPTNRHEHMRTADAVAADPAQTRREIDALAATQERQLVTGLERSMQEPERATQPVRVH